MLGSNIMNQLHDKNCLTYAGTAKEADLTAAGIWSNQIYDLDTGLKNLSGSFLLIKFRSWTMNRPELLVAYWSRIMVNSSAQNVEYTAKASVAYWNLNRCTSINSLHATGQTISRAHCDTTGNGITQMLHNLYYQIYFHVAGFTLDCNCVQNFWQLTC